MSQQVICDECGEPIDQAQPYVSGSAQTVQVTEGVLTGQGDSIQFDFHVEHAPGRVNPLTPKAELEGSA